MHWQGDGLHFSKRLEKGTFEIPKQSSSQNAMEYLHINFNLFLEELYFLLLKKSAYKHHFVDKKSVVAGVSGVV
ncbi:MAG: hypothetical protein IPN13_14525 [Bacteroidetes bacterium]|nr:hypothetical protein [Bacteroidota bacterium]